MLFTLLPSLFSSLWLFLIRSRDDLICALCVTSSPNRFPRGWQRLAGRLERSDLGDYRIQQRNQYIFHNHRQRCQHPPTIRRPASLNLPLHFFLKRTMTMARAVRSIVPFVRRRTYEPSREYVGVDGNEQCNDCKNIIKQAGGRIPIHWPALSKMIVIDGWSLKDYCASFK